MKEGLKVGDKVEPKIDLIDDLREHGMGCYLVASKGDEMYVREVYIPNEKYDFYAYRVSHKDVLDNSIYVKESEIQPLTT